jgi:hypothetical protein
MDKCADEFCHNGSNFWAVTQLCGQDQLWRKPDPRVVVSSESGLCYCECAKGEHYCYTPNCVTTNQMVVAMNTCDIEHAAYQTFVSVPGSDGCRPGQTDCTVSPTCRCPCPYPMCGYCQEPDVQEYVKGVCDSSGWWAGYPVVMSGPGVSFCSCLCPDTQAQTMRLAVPEADGAALMETGEGDTVLAAGLGLRWAPARVLARSSVSRWTPITAVKLETDAGAVTLAPDQLLLTARGTLKPAIAVDHGDRLATPDGGTQTVAAVRHLPVYALPLPFLALGLDPPDADLSGRLLALNGFVVGDHSLQVFALLDRLPRGLVDLSPAH